MNPVSSWGGIFRNDEDAPIKIESDSKSKSSVESCGNKVYFHSEVDRDKVLSFNKKIEELNNSLPLTKMKYNLVEDIGIVVSINSRGGYLLEGFSAMDTIINSRLPITTIVEGGCASAATLMSVVGRTRYITQHSFILIHQLTTACWGKYSEFKDTMTNIDKFMNVIRSVYLKYTKLPPETIDDILNHDLWLNSKECLEYGLVDAII